MIHDRELPLLGGIAAMLRWAEELANIIAGPLLTAGLAIALIDLLTDGALLTSQPELLYAWAISQAVGVDMQLVGSWDRARQALRTRRYWSLVGLLLLGVALAAVGYLAAVIFAMQQSAGISTAEALARLGMDSSTWLVSRAALSVTLVCLSGWTRYHPPAKVAPSLDEERAQIERELTLEPLRAELRARTAIGWRSAAGAIIKGNAPGPSAALPVRALDGAGVPLTADPQGEPAITPAAVQRATGTHDEPPDPGSPARSKRPVRTRRKKRTAPTYLRMTPEPAEDRIRAAWRAHPGATVKVIAEAAGVSNSAASKWLRVIRAEAEQRASERDAAAQ